MRNLTIALFSAFLFVATAATAFAAPTNKPKSENNPQVVAYYESGIHAIASDPVTYYEGKDLVMLRGSTGQIQQWYTGADNHGIHSVWNISKDGTCTEGWVLIEDAYPTWGDYLTPGADYCVHNNSF
jgi:hypothetical protein